MKTHTEARAKDSRVPATLAVVAVFLLPLAMAGCNKLKARDLMNKGVMAYRDGQYDASIEDFKQAKEADPGLLNARVYLATAYSKRWVAGAPSDENMRAGQQAINEFQGVLLIDPNNLAAIDGIGSLLYQMGTAPFDQQKLDDAKKYFLQHIALKPEDPDPYYRIAVEDWSEAYLADQEIRKKYNTENPTHQIQDANALPDNLRSNLAQNYGMLVDEGLQNVDKAISLQPDYTDAMVYQSLLLRQKADQSDKAARATLEQQASELARKANDIKQKAAANAAGS